MTLRASKPAFNIREKLTELGRRFGLKGSEIAAAETLQQVRDLLSIGRKNIVINGDLRITQRGTTTVSVGADPAAGGYQIHDRWRINNAQLDTLTVDYSHQGGSSSIGFRDSARLTCTAAETLEAGERFSFETRLEAKDTVFLKWGSYEARPITISFWVKSNLPGKYGVHVRHHDPGNGYVFPYTINQSDVWEYKTYTVPGDPYGTTNDDTGIGFWLRFMLQSGDAASAADEKWSTTDSGPNTTPDAVAWGSATGHTWEITGVQVEAGTNATEFERRSYSQELALCQRYFQGWNATSSTERAATGIFVYDDEGNSSANQTTIIGSGSVVDADDARIFFSLPVTMRNKPTPTGGDLRLITGGTLHNSSTTIQYNNSTIHTCSMMLDNGGGMTAGQCVHLIIKGNGYFYLDAEL